MRQIIFIFLLITLAACGAAAAAPDPVAAGGRIFTVQCGGCHAISDVGTDALGPRLDAMVARASAQPDPDAWLRQAIVSPNTEVATGYQGGLMPANYSQSLRADEVEVLVRYMLNDGG